MALHWELIERLAKAHRTTSPSASEASMFRSLKLWWCNKYNRPFKDPLIETYTLDELVYEYLTHYYLDPANDPDKKKAEEVAAQDDEDWIRKQLAGLGSGSGESGGSIGQSPPGAVGNAQAPVTPQEIKDVPMPDLPDLSTTFDE